MPSSSSSGIGFIGLGKMGIPMTHRLVRAGIRVVGYDISSDSQDQARAFGVEIAQRVEDVTADISVVILMLPDSDAIAKVLSDSLLDTMHAGTLLVDMGSSEPFRTRELATQLAERDLRLIDAPVSGGVSGATRGTLTIMAGGELTDIDEIRPVLKELGNVVVAGPIGSGHAIKALNNLMSATHLLITSEAIIAGEKFGLDVSVMLSIINGSSGRSGSTENKWPNFIQTKTFNSGFGLRLMLKDMRIAARLADQVGESSILGEEAIALWAKAAEDLPPAADHTEIARWLETRHN